RLLQSLLGTEVFADYCRLREIPFNADPVGPSPEDNLQRWFDVLTRLSPDHQARIERELAEVNELSAGHAFDHLLAAGDGGDLPPASIPAGAPLALWFYLHHAALFREVYLHHEMRDITAWRTARADPHLALGDVRKRAADLARGLRRFFHFDKRK